MAPLPLLRDLDTKGIPSHLQELWFLWQVPVECAFTHRHYNALEALFIGKDNGRFHRPQTLHIENGFAVVPCAFVNKIGLPPERLEGAIVVETYDQALQMTVLKGPKDAMAVYPVDIAQQFGIPQPAAQEADQLVLSNMMDYINGLDEQEAYGETVTPWEPLVFIPLF